MGVQKAQKIVVGAWRSLVAHLTGGQVVVGSNPIAPTILLVNKNNRLEKFPNPVLARHMGVTGILMRLKN